MSELVDEIRERLTQLDESMVAAINERLGLVADLVRHKRANDIPLSDPGREEWLHQHLVSVNTGPLSAEGVDQLCDFILALTRREAIDV